MFEQYIPLWIFVLIMVSTPGPANLLLMASGAQKGYAKTFPFLLGLMCGQFMLNIGIAFGLGIFMREHPLVGTIFAYGSASYMIWLAMRGWNSGGGGQTQDKLYSYRDGLIVHPLNPKAWVMGILAVSQFGKDFDNFYQVFLLIPLSFTAGQLVFHSVWCWAGILLHRALGNQSGKHLLMNRVLILLTIATVLSALLYGNQMA